jgi:hypothetical protein
MLYGVAVELDKTRTFRIGIRELIKIKKTGIDVNSIGGDFEDIVTLLQIGLERSEGTIEKDALISIIDDCSTSLEDIVKCFSQAVELGMSKKTTSIQGAEKNL